MDQSIRLGNTAKVNSDGTWNWTFYIRPAEYVEEAVVTLHPTFRNPVHHLRGPNMELSCSGWGTFELKVDIQWRGGEQLQTKWMLQFDEHQPDFSKKLKVPASALTLLSSDRDSARPTSLGSMCGEDDRYALVATLGNVPALDPGDDPQGTSWHGRLVQQDLPRPHMTWQSQRKPREDKHGKKDAPDWLNASEYRDDPQSLACKVSILAHLLRCSRKTLAYTGAGLSVAAGIEMAAAGSAKAEKSHPLAADPTLAHCVMAELNKCNLLHGWVQQNHDGLPQKAGYRQEDINEIHGSWYDPSNPVVLYSGSLRGDLYADMKDWAKSADLVLVLGTSLSGLNADQCVSKTAERSLPGRSKSLGSVIISPQRTPEDGEASLRLFACADDVMALLAKELNLQVRPGRALFSSELRNWVPYDKNGKRSDRVQTWWDLTPGAKLRVPQHNNIEGAQQPAYLGITPELVGQALPADNKRCCISVKFAERRSTMQLGIWWIDAALRGGVEYLPVVNIDAVEERLLR
eukprot:TRINITY_DN30994_c0_g1_i1.p1 TRINITY_DN30994_c0_g1~~TRINITY_DN30994_c0_g1_i1.p1  ORF type:complete len:518 (-),score=99.68 TRINITY_DN30994_c0_g1_i1:351-1904(-)